MPSKNNQLRINEELEKASEKYHILGAWIAIIFDPIFAITDYINIPDGWTQLLIIRLSISAITLGVLLSRKRLKIQSNKIIVFIPFTLISLQNAYTFSLISEGHIMAHCLNYIALLIGAGMFILWNWKYTAVSVLLPILATKLFVTLNPNIHFEEFLLQGGLLLIVVTVFMFILIKTRFDLTVREIKARLMVEEINEELVVQKDIVEQRNHQITSSIRYAQRIQNAILGNENKLSTLFPNSFTFFRPKDILSGDFYWFYENKEENIKIIVAADCTGHGVPGALTTVLGCSILNELVTQKSIYMPDQLLLELDKQIIKSFSTDNSKEPNINDGMDISVLTFIDNKIYFSAAKNPLYYVENGEMNIIKGSKFAIGSNHYKTDKVFDLHELNLEKGSKIYIFSDGFQDQIGSAKDQKYMTKRYREFLYTISNESMDEQREALFFEFEKWKGLANQTDDVLVIGIDV